MTQDDLPFEGVKVLDLSQGVAGDHTAHSVIVNRAKRFRRLGKGQTYYATWRRAPSRE